MSAAANDRSISNMERARIGVHPSDLADPAPVVRLDDLSDEAQRGLVDRYLRKYPFCEGLIGEAVNEHGSSEAIRACLMAGDTRQVGLLVDLAVREYIGGCVEREHYEWLEQAAGVRA